MRKRIPQEGGFTLLETLIAMFVFSIGLLGVMSMQVLAVRGNSFGDNNTRANTLCIEMIERIVNNAGAINAYDNLDTRTTGGPASGVALNDYRDWSQRIQGELGPAGFGTVTIQNNLPEPGANIVNLQVGWSDGANLRSVQMSTVISYP